MTRSTNRICGRFKKYDKIDETREDQREKDDVKREVRLETEEVKEWVKRAIAANPLVFDRLAEL